MIEVASKESAAAVILIESQLVRNSDEDIYVLMEGIHNGKVATREVVG